MLRYIRPHKLAVAGANEPGVLTGLVVHAVLVHRVVGVQQVVPAVRPMREPVVGTLLQPRLSSHHHVVLVESPSGLLPRSGFPSLFRKSSHTGPQGPAVVRARLVLDVSVVA